MLVCQHALLTLCVLLADCAEGLASTSPQWLAKRASSLESGAASSVEGPSAHIAQTRPRHDVVVTGVPFQHLNPAFRAQMQHYVANMHASIARARLTPQVQTRSHRDKLYSTQDQQSSSGSSVPAPQNANPALDAAIERQRGRILGGIRSGETRRHRAEERHRLVEDRLRHLHALKQERLDRLVPQMTFHQGWPPVMTVTRTATVKRPLGTLAPSTDLQLASNPTYAADGAATAKRHKAVHGSFSDKYAPSRNDDGLQLSLAPPGRR